MQQGMVPVGTWQGFTVRKPSQTHYSAEFGCSPTMRGLDFHHAAMRQCTSPRFKRHHPLTATCDVHHFGSMQLNMPLLSLSAMYDILRTSLC
jgi:hypothetical protein